MVEEFYKDMMSGRIVLLILLVLSTSVFLSSCSKTTINKKEVIISKIPVVTWIKDSLKLYHFKNDTIFKKFSKSHWGKTYLEYVLISNKEVKKINYLIDEIISVKPEKVYASKSDNIEFEKEVRVYEKNKEIVSTLVYAEKYPKIIDSMFDQISIIYNKHQIKKLKIDSLKSTEINSLRKKNDTINNSMISSYLLMKK